MSEKNIQNLLSENRKNRRMDVDPKYDHLELTESRVKGSLPIFDVAD